MSNHSLADALDEARAVITSYACQVYAKRIPQKLVATFVTSAAKKLHDLKESGDLGLADDSVDCLISLLGHLHIFFWLISSNSPPQDMVEGISGLGDCYGLRETEVDEWQQKIQEYGKDGSRLEMVFYRLTKPYATFFGDDFLRQSTAFLSFISEIQQSYLSKLDNARWMAYLDNVLDDIHSKLQSGE